MVFEVIVSDQFEMTLPAQAARSLKVKPGDRVSVIALEDRVILYKKVDDTVAALRGSSLGLRYPPDYLDRERDDW